MDNKRALITGGGKGIGEAVARTLAQQGYRCIVAGRDKDALTRVADDIAGEFRLVDLRDRQATDRFISSIDSVDVLVNNAGGATSEPLPRMTDELWDQMLELNTTAAFRLCRSWVPGMAQRGWGRVINVSSTAGLSGYRYSSGYCAAKHALIGLTRSLAIDYANKGITVNAVCPGWVDTAEVDKAVARIVNKTGRGPSSVRGQLAEMCPQERIIETSEVAAMIAFLCSHDARGVNGQTLVVDGGQVLK